jgi:hypothetical protein
MSSTSPNRLHKRDESVKSVPVDAKDRSALKAASDESIGWP